MAAIALVLLVGTMGYIWIEGVAFLPALYMSFITVTTIGYDETFPLSDGGRIFTIFLGLGGIGIILFGVSEIARYMVEGGVREMIGFGRKNRMVKGMSGHVIVCGYGRTGRWVIDTLKASKVAFVVIDIDREQCLEFDAAGIAYIVGDASTKSVLEEAGIARANSLIACLSDDATNVYAILLARQLNSDVRIISRALDEDAVERLCMAGADQVINPYRIGGHRLAYSAVKPAVTDFLETTLQRMGENLIIEEVELGAASRLVGKSLAASEIRSKLRVVILGLKRGSKSFFNPEPEEELQAGDVLVALGPQEALHTLEEVARAQ